MATRTASRFSLAYAVDATVPADPDVVWRLLSDGAGFPGWNSTVTSIEGATAVIAPLKATESKKEGAQ